MLSSGAHLSLREPPYIDVYYFPCICKIPATIIQPQAIPTANEPEVIARAHTEDATPDRPVLIISLLGGTDVLGGPDGTGAMSVGFGFPSGRSFATANNAGPNNVIPKIAKAVVTPRMKDFRFDLGFSLDSLNFFLKLILKF
jgi:hypothetical protein